MEDVISRQAAVDAICMEWCGVKNNGCEHEFYRKVDKYMYCDGCDDVNVIKALPPAQRWIPCKERLPEKERKTYWVCTDEKSQLECRWTNNVHGFGESDHWGWKVIDLPKCTMVVAWRELPEPYREEQDG